MARWPSKMKRTTRPSWSGSKRRRPKSLRARVASPGLRRRPVGVGFSIRHPRKRPSRPDRRPRRRRPGFADAAGGRRLCRVVEGRGWQGASSQMRPARSGELALFLRKREKLAEMPLTGFSSLGIYPALVYRRLDQPREARAAESRCAPLAERPAVTVSAPDQTQPTLARHVHTGR
jgi:hypothetical protein